MNINLYHREADVTKLVAFIVFLLLSAVACSDKEKQQSGMPPQQMTVPVVVEKVVQKDMPVQVKAVGTVEALASVRVKPQVAGLLLSVHFKEGQNVNRGISFLRSIRAPFRRMLQKRRQIWQKTWHRPKRQESSRCVMRIW